MQKYLFWKQNHVTTFKKPLASQFQSRKTNEKEMSSVHFETVEFNTFVFLILEGGNFYGEGWNMTKNKETVVKLI